MSLKHARNARARVWAPPAGIALMLVVAAPAMADDAVREAMAGVFGAVRVLLPLSVTEGAFRDPAHKAVVAKAIALLDKSATRTAAHMARRGAEDAASASRALEDDVREIRARFDAGDDESSAFLVRRLTDRCVACHLRLPDKVDSPLSTAFVDASALGSLPPHKRAPLYVAVRQFEEALSTWEAAFAHEKVSREVVAGVEPYLATSVRSRRDLKRPLGPLGELATRDDVPQFQRDAIAAHLARLKLRRNTFAKPPTLADVRALVAPALEPEATRDALPLVDALIASAHLQTLLEGKALRGAEHAEAHFLLGLAQARVGGQERGLLAPASLEAAVRDRSGGPFRRQAFRALSRLLKQDYLGSSGQALPADVEQRLNTLRALLPPSGPQEGKRRTQPRRTP